MISLNGFRRAAAVRILSHRPIVTGKRSYRGDAGEEVTNLSHKEEELLKIAMPRADEIFKRHIELPVDDIETRRKRLIYRSKQRGWLEGKIFFIQMLTFGKIKNCFGVLTFLSYFDTSTLHQNVD